MPARIWPVIIPGKVNTRWERSTLPPGELPTNATDCGSTGCAEVESIGRSLSANGMVRPCSAPPDAVGQFHRFVPRNNSGPFRRRPTMELDGKSPI
jgi:hypothetical protein